MILASTSVRKREDKTDMNTPPPKPYVRGGSITVLLKNNPLTLKAPDSCSRHRRSGPDPRAEHALRCHAVLRQRPGGASAQGNDHIFQPSSSSPASTAAAAFCN
jgi:hypothetical protein